MKGLLELLISNFWLFLIYQINFDPKTRVVRFMEKDPLPNNMTKFFKKHGVSMSKEEKTLFQNFAHCCKDYIIFLDIKYYLETSEDTATKIVQQLLYMTHKFHKKMEIANFFMCFMAPAENDGQFVLKFTQLMFDYYQMQQFHEIERAIELINKHTEAITTWYEQTPAMTQVFSELDRQYTVRWSTKEVLAFHYSNTKERYLELAKKEQEKMIQYLEPPPPKKEEEPTESNFDRLSDDDEIDYDYGLRNLVLCSAEPHQ